MVSNKRAGIIAEESEQFDTRELIRLSTWGITAVVAVTTTIFATRSEVGTKRLHAAVMAITTTPAETPPVVIGQLLARTADVERESRRLNDTVRTLTNERDRLQTRVGLVEREVGDLTGSITKSLGSLTKAAEPKSVPTMAPQPVAAAPPPVVLAPTTVEARSVRTITAPPLIARSEPPLLAAQSSEPEPPAAAPTAPVTTASLPDVIPLPAPRPSEQMIQAALGTMRNTPAPPAGETTPPAAGPVIAAKPDAGKSDAAKPEARVEAKAETEEPQPKAEIGLDLGPAITMARLRERWAAFKSSYAAMADGMRPVISIREVGKNRSVEMRLVVGPVPDVQAAATMCSALSGSQFPCHPALFDGQRLAQK